MRSHPAICMVVIALGLTRPALAAAQCRPVHVDLHVRDQRALVDVAIDGRPARLVLDTGASQILLMNDAPDRIGLPPADDHPPEQRMSYGRPFQVRFVHARHVALAGLVRDITDLPVAGTDGETGVDGFFTDTRLQEADINFGDARIDLYCDGAPAWTSGRDVIRLPLEDRPRPFGPAIVNGVALRVLFDTGSPVSSMTLDAARRSGVPVAAAPDDHAQGIGEGALRAWTTRIPLISLGGHSFHDVPIQVVDKPNASADMIAGFDFFLCHRVWIDRKGGRLVIQGADLF